MKENNAREPPWDELTHIQSIVEKQRPSSPAEMHGIDEAYTMVVSEVTEHTAQSLRRRFWNLVSNRVPKYRRRNAIENRLAWGTPAEGARDPIEVLVQLELVSIVQTEVEPGEDMLLWGVATGRSYEELASAMGVPVGTLKARASRLRRRLRATLTKANSEKSHRTSGPVSWTRPRPHAAIP